MSWFNDLANPTRFLNLSAKLLPWLWSAALIILTVGFYMAFFVAPEDYQQGQTIRIMFIHVPFAWLAMATYALMAISSIGTLVWKHPLADVSAKAAAPLGAAFALICLLTGSFWGKPMWGAWWVWDARLTSMLVLFLMYLGLIALWNAVEDPIRAGKAAAVLTLVGSINLPIIKFSVDWWNTLHQPASVFRFDGPTIHVYMITQLLMTYEGMNVLFLALHMVAMRTEILRRRVRTLRLLEASRAVEV